MQRKSYSVQFVFDLVYLVRWSASQETDKQICMYIGG